MPSAPKAAKSKRRFIDDAPLATICPTVGLGQTDHDREYPKDKLHPEGTLRDSAVRSIQSSFQLACNLSLRIWTVVAKTKHGRCVGEPKNRPNKVRGVGA